MTGSRLIDSISMRSADERRRMRENARRALDTAGPRAAEARAVLEALDAFEAQDSDRRMQRPIGPDMIARVADAFRQMPMSPADEKLVRIVLDNPDASSERLTEALGWKGQAWQLHFGKLCQRREHLLWPAPPEPTRGNDPFYSGILADFDERTRGFTLKPEVTEAFAQLGLRPRGPP
jgi:hypothetical protein